MIQYDPLGMASPVILRLKALMQRTISPEYGLDWDADLPVQLEIAWHQLIRLLVRCPQIEFLRAVKPIGLAEGMEVLLIVYWGGSDTVKAAVIYCLWLKSDDAYEVHLLTSKAWC